MHCGRTCYAPGEDIRDYKGVKTRRQCIKNKIPSAAAVLLKYVLLFVIISNLLKPFYYSNIYNPYKIYLTPIPQI